jgi:cap1 methyltransferase
MNNLLLLKNIEKKLISKELEITIFGDDIKKPHIIFKKFVKDLIKHKDLIDNNLKEWNNLKKYVNPYELIYSPIIKTNISKYQPVSRSFFKLWEMINKFKLLDNSKKNVVSTIAEGPGGFIECILKFQSNNLIYSTTLYPSNKDIPSWSKLNKKIEMYKVKNLNLLYHNIYNYDDYLKYIENFKDNKADFVTADGGFDYSIDFNRQEEMSYRIIFSEIIIALSIQKLGGNFVLKIFDIFTIFTLKYIYLLYLFYEDVYIYKPLTSRVANSEKYIICKNFKGVDEDIMTNLIDLYKKFNLYENKNIDIKNLLLPNDFILAINGFNENYVKNQINFIDKTLDIIENKSNIGHLMDEQKFNAQKWCEIYNFNI